MRTFHSDLSWNFLIASPVANSTTFKKSVIFLFEDNAEVAMGVIINRPLNKCIAELSDITPNGNLGSIDVYEGGPVGINELKIGMFVLNDTEVGSFHYGITPQKLDILSKSPYDIKPMAFLGCACWGRQQLRDEIKSGVWITSNVDMNIIFEIPPEELWRTLLTREYPTLADIEKPDGNFKSN